MTSHDRFPLWRPQLFFSCLIGASIRARRCVGDSKVRLCDCSQRTDYSSSQINHTQLMINEKFVDSASGKTFPTLDPRSGEVITRVAEGDAEDINRAVHAARRAFNEGPWPRMTAYVGQTRFMDCCSC